MIRVIGAGFGRTGTLSLKAALQHLLGGRCYHMSEAFKHPDHAEGWIRADRGDLGQLTEILRGYVATVDWPGCAFWRELMDIHPEALVLLSVRPAERWYASFHDTVHQTLTHVPSESAALAITEPIHELGELVVKQRSFGPNYERLGREGLIAAYERHNDQVRSTVPPQRLLEYSVEQGWEPLCGFLDLNVPDIDFPVRNDRERFRENFGLE